MNQDTTPNAVRASERRAVLLRRLSDARAILGCGDDPDRNAALDEIEFVERELELLATRRDEGGSR